MGVVWFISNLGKNHLTQNTKAILTEIKARLFKMIIKKNEQRSTSDRFDDEKRQKLD